MSCYSFLFVGTDSSLMVAVFVTVPPCILSTNNLLYFQTQNKYIKKATEIRLVDVNDNKAIWCHCVDCGLTPLWPWLWYDMVWGWQSLGHSQWNLVSCFPVFILQCQIVIANINLRWQQSSERRGSLHRIPDDAPVSHGAWWLVEALNLYLHSVFRYLKISINAMEIDSKKWRTGNNEANKSP